MATIKLRGKKYRAEVSRHGTRRSKSFVTYDVAAVWARGLEQEILGGVAPWKSSPPPPPVHEIEAASIEAGGLHKGLAEILEQPRFRPACGVYFLIDDDEVVYVGQSTELHARVAQHRARWKQFDSYTYIPCESSQLAELERHYIRLFRPCLNISGVPNNG